MAVAHKHAQRRWGCSCSAPLLLNIFSHVRPTQRSRHLLATAYCPRRSLSKHAVTRPTTSSVTPLMAAMTPSNDFRDLLRQPDPDPDRLHQCLEQVAYHAPKQLRNLLPTEWRKILLTLGRSPPSVAADRVATALRWKARAGITVTIFDVHVLAMANTHQRKTAEDLELFLTETKKFLRIKPDQRLYEILVCGLLGNGEADEAIRFIEQSLSDQSRNRVWDTNLVRGILSTLQRDWRAKCRDLASRKNPMLLEKLAESTETVMRRILQICITHLGATNIGVDCYNFLAEVVNTSIRSICDARLFLQRMEVEGFNPDTDTINILAGHLLANDKVEDMKILLRETRNTISQNACTLRLLITACCNDNDLKQAVRTYTSVSGHNERMKRALLSGDSTFADAFVIVLSKDIQYLSVALRVAYDLCNIGIFPPKKATGTIIRRLISQGRAEEARMYFYAVRKLMSELSKERLQELESKDQLPFDTPICNLVISALLAQNKRVAANELFREMSIAGCKPDIVTYTTLINYHAKHNENAEVYDLLTAMRYNEIKPDVVLYSTLLNVMLKQGRTAEATRVMREMTSAGVEPNSYTYNIFLSGLIRSRHLKQAEELRQRMEKFKVPIDAVSDNVMMSGYMKAGMLDKVLAIWNTRQRDKLPADRETYNIVMQTLCMKGEINEAERILRSITEDTKGEMQPNVVSYNIILTGYLKQDRLEDALRLLGEMRARTPFPLVNAITYDTLITHLCRLSQFAAAEQSLKEALLVLPRETFQSRIYIPLMAGLAKREQSVGPILRIVDLLRSSGLTLDSYTYATVISAYTTTRFFEGAQEWITKATSQPPWFWRNRQLMHAVLDWHAKQGDVTSMDATFAEMCEGRWGFNTTTVSRKDMKHSRNRLIPDVATYNILITGYAFGRQWEKAMGTWKTLWRLPSGSAEHKKSMTGPVHRIYGVDNTTVSVLIDALGFSSRLAEVESVWADIQRAAFPLDTNNYTSYIEALVRCGEVSKACEMVMGKMQEQGVEPDAKTFRSLLGLIRNKEGNVSDTAKQIWKFVNEQYGTFREDIEKGLDGTIRNFEAISGSMNGGSRTVAKASK